MKKYFNPDNTAFNLASSGARRFFILILLLLPAFSFSQLNVCNTGLVIGNYNDSVIIRGSMSHTYNNGRIKNDGNIYITGNWTNSSLGNVFDPGDGWVHFDNTLDGISPQIPEQTIFGPQMTHFNNLELAGTGIKYLDGNPNGNPINAEIEDTLALNDHEFDIDVNSVLVLDSDTGVITRTTGFVSSIDDGGLDRSTAHKSAYFFPVGSSLGTAIFRPVDITPEDDSPNSFKVRMANKNPDDDSYFRNVHEATVGDINPNWYHKINQTTTSTKKADITIYYDGTADNDFVYDIIARWEDLSEWKNPGLAVPASKYNLTGLTTKAFDFTATPLALPALIPFALSVNVELSSEIFVANVFSPNGDGINDILFMRGKGIAEMQFTIFDRWGEKVFETNDINTGWDGTYRGEEMNMAVFVYFIKGTFTSGDAIDKKGNFTLLR